MYTCTGSRYQQRMMWLHYPGHTNTGIMPDNGGVSSEFKIFVPI